MAEETNQTDKIFSTLSDGQIERVERSGRIENLKKRTVLFERGDRSVDSFVVLAGNIEICEHTRAETRNITTHTRRRHQFTGELDLFGDHQILVGGRMGEDGTVVSWRNTKTGETETRRTGRVFLMLGAVPNTDWLKNSVKMDEKVFILTGAEIEAENNGWKLKRPPLMLETSTAGVSAAGDARSGAGQARGLGGRRGRDDD